MFAVLSALLASGGLVAQLQSGAWYTGATLFVFVGLGWAIPQHECHEKLPAEDWRSAAGLPSRRTKAADRAIEVWSATDAGH